LNGEEHNVLEKLSFLKENNIRKMYSTFFGFDIAVNLNYGYDFSKTKNNTNIK